MKQIYLDNQATTSIDKKVYEAMKPWFIEKFGNAASRNHLYGWEADEAVEIARESVANIIGAHSREIIFTSGATESNNIAIQGVAKNYIKDGGHIITVQTEHKSVLDVCDYLGKIGFEITKLSVHKDGLLDLNKLEESIRKDTLLISIMHANNEIGVIQPILEIGEICKKHNIIFHVDASQSIGKIPVAIYNMAIDLMSFSAHKLYGPKGVGALFIRKKNPRLLIHPIIYGGGHERGIRSGTLPVPNIVGFGEACNIAMDVMSSESKRIKTLRDNLRKRIELETPDSQINGHYKHRIPGNLNMRFPGVNNEAIISSAPEIAISSGATCTTSTSEPSHVLLALGLSADEANSSVRFGIGRFNTNKDVLNAAKCMINSIKKLKNMSYGK